MNPEADHAECAEQAEGLVTVGSIRAAVRSLEESRAEPAVQANTALLAMLNGDHNIAVRASREMSDRGVDELDLCARVDHPFRHATDHATVSVPHGRLRPASWLPAPRPVEELVDVEVLADEGRWPSWPRLWLLKLRYGAQTQIGFLRAMKGDRSKRTPFRVYVGQREQGKLPNEDYASPAEVRDAGWQVVRSWSYAERKRMYERWGVDLDANARQRFRIGSSRD